MEPLSMIRRSIAERMQRSLATTAQLTETAEVDVTELAAELERLSVQWGRRASYVEVAVQACAACLRDHPRIAAVWAEDGLAYQDQIDIGVAVSLEDGLIVPVIRSADDKDLETLNREIAEIAEAARAGTLSKSDIEGGVFSITNLGTYPIDAFTPVLNPPQTAVLGIGRARLRPAVHDGAIEARKLMVLSLTFDHRVIDGAPAAAFLTDVVRRLEHPAHLG
jgi:pyruvate dehydrogenase E2 component (dihydrolipoamide acetyltransferase)